MTGTGRVVTFVEPSLPRYRGPLFKGLRSRLAVEGVTLRLIHGDGDRASGGKGDQTRLPWAEFVPNRRFRLGSRELVLQPVASRLRGSDLVIVDQASRLLLNYVLQIQQVVGTARVAFYGHGRNFQAAPGSEAAEWVKARLLTAAHWWFAYNRVTREVVERAGYPADRVTVVQNAIDTRSLRSHLEDVRGRDREIRDRFGIVGGNVCIFCGGMYAEKQLPFLFDAARAIRQRIPDFELVLVGSGPDRALAEAQAAHHDWIHYVGPRFDREKAELFSVCKLQLMPGLVGLGILDSFALETPMVTRRVPYHSPEIAYLEDGRNGAITDPGLEAFVDAVIHLLSNDDALGKLRQGAAASADRYTIEAMIDNFAGGIHAALQAPTRSLFASLRGRAL